MITKNRSCYDHNVRVVANTPHCDYSTLFSFAIIEKRKPMFSST